MSNTYCVSRVLFLTLILISGLFPFISDVYAQKEFVADELIIKIKEGRNSIDIENGLTDDGIPIVG